MRFASFLIYMTFATGPLQQTPALQDLEQRQGPFTIARQTFTVVLHNKRLMDSQTLALLEIRDQSNALQYQKTFPSQVEGTRFQQTVSASAKLVSGNGLAGLSIRYRREPAPAGNGESWQIFRFRDGKLALLDTPVNARPGAANGVFTGAIRRGANGAGPIIVQPDIIELRVWAGNFYLIVPLRVDWRQGRTMPGEQCFEMAGSPGLAEVGCEMRVEAERKPVNGDFTFVRLFNEARENLVNARHVVVKKDAKIEYLAGKAIVKWTANGDESSIGLTDVWLKVLIDDNEDNLGWMHTNEDFSAVGLPTLSPAP